jgi:hypothetical protein
MSRTRLQRPAAGSGVGGQGVSIALLPAASYQRITEAVGGTAEAHEEGRR